MLVFVPGQQVSRHFASLVNVRSADECNQAAPAVIRADAGAGQVNIDRTTQRSLSLARPCAGGGRVDAKRMGGVLHRCLLPVRLAVGRQCGQHLQITQLGCSRQDIGDQQHAQPGDIRRLGGARRVRAYP